jgi:hypothetical protein
VPGIEQGIVRDRARRHDSHDFARDRALALADDASLFFERALSPVGEAHSNFMYTN